MYANCTTKYSFLFCFPVSSSIDARRITCVAGFRRASTYHPQQPTEEVFLAASVEVMEEPITKVTSQPFLSLFKQSLPWSPWPAMGVWPTRPQCWRPMEDSSRTGSAPIPMESSGTWGTTWGTTMPRCPTRTTCTTQCRQLSRPNLRLLGSIITGAETTCWLNRIGMSGMRF